MKLPFLIVLFCLFLGHANGQEKPTIVLGSGGGITGMATAYSVMPSGKVYKGKGIGEIKYTDCAKIKRGKARKMIARVTAAVSSANFDHPGNLYYFLILKENDGEKKVTWGSPDEEVPDEIQRLYDEIHQTISTLKYKPITEKN